MRAVLQELGPAFEKSSGHKLVIEYATAGKVEEKVVADEAIDVAILTKPRIDKLVSRAKIVDARVGLLNRLEEEPTLRLGGRDPGAENARSPLSRARARSMR